MISNIYNKLLQLATTANIFYAILAQTLLQILLVLVLIPKAGLYSSEKIFDLRMYYTSGDISKYLTELGKAGRDAYLYNEIIDLIYPFAYATALLLLTIYLGQKAFKSPKPVIAALFLPLLVFLTDYAENSSILSMIILYPIENFLYFSTGYLTLIKHILLGANIVLLTLFSLLAVKRQIFYSQK
ncbi:MAG: hypothetical protein OEV66_03535 [Spirochaetia bacterium]|nr:hypothetical protein [Spirochaetia bacterium]